MKRSGFLKRRTPLRSRTRLARRKTLLPRSAKARALRDAADPVVAAVFDRDGGCVLRSRPDEAGECFGGPTPHHLLKASQGGGWTVDNLVTLCRFHNGWVEDRPEHAWQLGLVVRRGETTALAWQRMRNYRLAVGRLLAAYPDVVERLERRR